MNALVLAGGTLYAGGEFTAARSGGSPVGRRHLAAFNAATGALTSFDPFSSMSQNSTVTALAFSDPPFTSAALRHRSTPWSA